LHSSIDDLIFEILDLKLKHKQIQVTSKGVILSASDDITIKVWCIGKG
jgi:hypothetical protein